MDATSTNEVRSSLMDSNTRCMALETKLGGVSMDHRAAQRKMASELDSRVRAMDTLRSGVESEVKSLKNKNDRLYSILLLMSDQMKSHGLELPVEALAELGSEERQQGDGVGVGDGDEGDRTGRLKTRNSRSPSPFRRFMGKRAASPSRSAPTPPQPQKTVPSPPVPAPTAISTQPPPDAGVVSAAARLKPVSFRRFAPTNNEKNDVSNQSRPVVESGVTSSTREASPSAAATRSSGSTGGGSTGGGGSGVSGGSVGDTNAAGKSNMTDLLQDRRNTSREVAAQKHAARLKAVRTSSRGKWGFSV